MGVDNNKISQLVQTIRNAEDPESVTNLMIADLAGDLLSLVVEAKTTADDGVQKAGDALTRVGSAEVSISDARKEISGMVNTVVAALWKYALGDTCDSPDYMYPLCGSNIYTLIRNGYFPSSDSQFPFWLFGKKLSLVQAIKVLFSQWHPLAKTGLRTFEARTHLPVSIYTGEDEAECAGQFNIDMCHVGSGVIESIALRYETVDFYSSVFSVFQDSDGNDVQGWKINAGLPCIMPRSMYRAFDGAKTLFQILGGIDCRLMGTNGMRYAFRNCRDLHRMRLFNIPDVITELDLSWSPNISPVVLHQLTFWHNGSSWAGRADSAEPFVILMHPKAWDDYQDERYWSQIYSTFTYEQWISNMKAKKVSIYVMDHENPANSDYVLEPAGTRSVAGMMSARQLSSAEEAGSEDIEADGQSDASDSYTLKDSEVDPAALPGVQSLDGGEAES